jgi:predicted Fe-Mo cluster-binding NifX family protein
LKHTRDNELHSGLKTPKFLLNNHIDVLITSTIGEISFHILKDSFVEIFQSKVGTLQEVLNRYNADQLIKLKELTYPSDRVSTKKAGQDL